MGFFEIWHFVEGSVSHSWLTYSSPFSLNFQSHGIHHLHLQNYLDKKQNMWVFHRYFVFANVLYTAFCTWVEDYENTLTNLEISTNLSLKFLFFIFNLANFILWQKGVFAVFSKINRSGLWCYLLSNRHSLFIAMPFSHGSLSYHFWPFL